MTCPPLFTHQYSHCWIDFRAVQDSVMQLHHLTYALNTRFATLAQHAYCIADPGGWVGYNGQVDPKWVLGDRPLNEQSLRLMVSDTPVDPAAVRVYVPVLVF